jgi:hypothetical protein
MLIGRIIYVFFSNLLTANLKVIILHLYLSPHLYHSIPSYLIPFHSDSGALEHSLKNIVGAYLKMLAGEESGPTVLVLWAGGADMTDAWKEEQ